MSRPATDCKRQFLAAFAVTGMIGKACQIAGCERTTVHRWRKRDAKFAEQFDIAKAEAADALESEARRRAIEGTRRYKFKRDGSPILHPVTGEVYYESEYSDALLIALLRAYNPKFRDVGTTINAGATAIAIYLPANGRDENVGTTPALAGQHRGEKPRISV